MDANEQRILEAIGRLEEKFDQKSVTDEERFRRIEEDVTDVRERLTTRAKQDAEFADSLTKCAGAAARAAEIAYQAQRSANDVRDEATKIVQSALAIHNASIAVAVDETVKRAVQPIASEVSAIKTNDEKQNTELAEIKGLVQGIADVVVRTVRNKWLVRAVIAAALLGALIGGGLAGYSVAEGAAKAKSSETK